LPVGVKDLDVVTIGSRTLTWMDVCPQTYFR